MSDSELRRIWAGVGQAIAQTEDRTILKAVKNAIGQDGQLAPHAAQRLQSIQTFAFWLPGTLTVATNAAQEFTLPMPGTIVRINAIVKTAPFGASMLGNITRNGTSIRSLTIPAGSLSVQYGLAVAAAEADVLRINITQAGGATPASGLTVTVGWIPTLT